MMTRFATARRRVPLLVVAILAVAGCSGDHHSASDALPVALGGAGPGDAGAHFPMEVGNVWQFAGGTYMSPEAGAPMRTYGTVVRTTGTRVVGGAVATVFQESNASGDGVAEESLLVADAQGIAFFGNGEVDVLSAQLVPYWELRFPLEVGSSFVQVNREGVSLGEDLDGDLVDERANLRSVVAVRGIETVTVPAGSFSGCVRVEWGALMDVALSRDGTRVRTKGVQTAWLAPGVGWVKRETAVSIVDQSYIETTREELVAYSVNGRSGQITLRVTPETATVTPYGTARLQAQAFTPEGAPIPGSPAAPSGVPVTWTSSNPGVAQVYPDGTVAGVASGTTTVTAFAGEIASNPVTVTVGGTTGGGALARISVAPAAVTVAKNGTAQLSATAYDAQGYSIYSTSFSWSSDDTAVATVDGNGVVRGIGPGTAHVTASSGAITSSAATVTVSAVELLSLATNDLVYDPSRERIYASVPSRQGAGGNSVAIIDPATRAIDSTVFVGSEPTKLALSDDGRFLYVALDGAAKVARLDLTDPAGPTTDLTFTLGSVDFSGQRFVEDMEVMPGAPGTVAISMKYKGSSPRHAGVAVFDDGVQRPTATPGHTGSNVIEFSSSGGLLYGLNNETTEFGFRRMKIDAQGVTVLTVDEIFSGFGTDIAFDRGLVFGTGGQAVDPEARALVGTFTGLSWGALVVPDPVSTRVLYLTQGDAYSGPWALEAYDRERFVALGSEIVPSVSGTPGSLVRWGASGIAFRTSSDEVVLLETPLAGP